MRPAILFVVEPYRAEKPLIRILRDMSGDERTGETLFKKLPKDYALTGFTRTNQLAS